MRLKRATSLLEQNHATIADIAYQFGFSSPAYFSRRFREVYGCTPKGFQASLKRNNKSLARAI